MKKQDEDYEEHRRQAFLEYQKTGKMNDIVAKEFMAYEKEANKGNKRLIYVAIAVFLIIYFAIYGILLWNFFKNFHIGWGFLCICYTAVTGIAIYVIVQMARKRKRK